MKISRDLGFLIERELLEVDAAIAGWPWILAGVQEPTLWLRLIGEHEQSKLWQMAVVNCVQSQGNRLGWSAQTQVHLVAHRRETVPAGPLPGHGTVVEHWPREAISEC